MNPHVANRLLKRVLDFDMGRNRNDTSAYVEAERYLNSLEPDIFVPIMRLFPVAYAARPGWVSAVRQQIERYGKWQQEEALDNYGMGDPALVAAARRAYFGCDDTGHYFAPGADKCYCGNTGTACGGAV